ncbi:MAG: adenosine deaminase [Clostridiales bacterium]|nr:adenosine deaminase [Clostridiales bacterium]
MFVDGLTENNRQKLLDAPKSDLHNHSTKGCRLAWLETKIDRKLPRPPRVFDGLMGMQEWFTGSIKPYCSGSEGIILRWEGAFAEAKRNNIKRLSMNFGAAEIELVGGMDTFREIIESCRRMYCHDTVFEPELTYVSACDINAEAEKIEQYLSSGYFRSIDVCGGEDIRPFEDFLPLYRKASQYGLIKRIHVGESGSAEDVRRAVDILELDEIHHGIHAASSDEVMRFLADNRIQLNVCPSSNVMLGYAPGFRDHPIKILYENGVKVTINTDDLLIFDSSIENEYLLLYNAGTLTAGQLDDIRLTGLATK